MKKLVLGVVALFLVLLAGAAAFVAFAPGERLRPLAEWAASFALERDVTIGRFDIERGTTTTVTMTDITLANANWVDAAPLAEVDAATISFRVWSLFDPRIDLPLVNVTGATLRPTTGANGRANWAGVDTDAPAPDDRTEAPVLRDVRLSDIRVIYGAADEPGATTALHEILITSGEGAAAPATPVTFRADGVYRGQDLTITAEGDAFNALVARAEPYAFALTADGAVKAAISGALAPDSTLGPMDIKLSGPTLTALNPFIPAPLPDTPPFSLEGRLSVAEGVYGMKDLSGVIGDSDVRGDVEVVMTGERPLLRGELRSDNLDFDDLAGLIGAEPDPTETANAEQEAEAAGGPLIPDTPVPVAEFRRADIDLRLVASKVSSPVAQVESLDAHFKLENGRLLVKPLTLGVSGGTVAGEVAVNAREDIPSADIDVTLTDVSLSRFFAGSEFAQEMGGDISGDVYVLGVGATLADMFTTARGGGHAILRDGRISGLIVEGAGVDVVEALGLLLAGDVAIPMECAVAAVDINEGLLRIERGAASTSDSLVIASGHVDLGAPAVRMQVEARAKDFSLIDLNVPVLVEGPLTDPGFSLGGLDPLPFFELGDAESANCDLLVREAQQAAPGRSK